MALTAAGKKLVEANDTLCRDRAADQSVGMVPKQISTALGDGKVCLVAVGDIPVWPAAVVEHDVALHDNAAIAITCRNLNLTTRRTLGRPLW